MQKHLQYTAKGTKINRENGMAKTVSFLHSGRPGFQHIKKNDKKYCTSIQSLTFPYWTAKQTERILSEVDGSVDGKCT
jgi:hypothetical protein